MSDEIRDGGDGTVGAMFIPRKPAARIPMTPATPAPHEQQIPGGPKFEQRIFGFTIIGIPGTPGQPSQPMMEIGTTTLIAQDWAALVNYLKSKGFSAANIWDKVFINIVSRPIGASCWDSTSSIHLKSILAGKVTYMMPGVDVGKTPFGVPYCPGTGPWGMLQGAEEESIDWTKAKSIIAGVDGVEVTFDQGDGTLGTTKFGYSMQAKTQPAPNGIVIETIVNKRFLLCSQRMSPQSKQFGPAILNGQELQQLLENTANTWNSLLRPGMMLTIQILQAAVPPSEEHGPVLLSATKQTGGV